MKIILRHGGGKRTKRDNYREYHHIDIEKWPNIVSLSISNNEKYRVERYFHISVFSCTKTSFRRPNFFFRIWRDLSGLFCDFSRLFSLFFNVFLHVGQMFLLGFGSHLMWLRCRLFILFMYRMTLLPEVGYLWATHIYSGVEGLSVDDHGRYIPKLHR